MSRKHENTFFSEEVQNQDKKMNTVIVICRDTEGVLKSANDTEFGLASGVFSNDLSKVCMSDLFGTESANSS